MTLKKTYNFSSFGESKYLLFINVIEQGFFFIVFLVFARRLPVDTYGEMITLFTLSNVFITLLNFGLPIYLQRQTAVSSADSGGLFGKILSLNILLFFVYIIFTTGYYFLFYRTLPLSLFIVTTIPIYLYSDINIINALFSGLGKYKLQFLTFLNARIFTIIVFILTAFFFSSSPVSLLIIYSFGFLYQLILLIINAKKENVFIFLNFNISELIGILKFSLPLGMAVVFNYLYDKIDILLISNFTDYSQVSYYNVGYGIYKASSIAFSFLLISGLTRVSYLSRNPKAVKMFFKKYSSIFFVVGLILSVLLFLLSGFIVNIIYSVKFLPSALILKIVSFAVIGLALNNLTGVILNGLGLYRENMYVTFAGLVINLVLNFIFIPLYGIIAAALVSVLTEYFIFAGDYYFINNFLKEENGNI